MRKFAQESIATMESTQVANAETVIADIRDDRRLAMVFDRFRPAIVFHAAAHKHVPLMEENPEEAITNNIVGTRNVVNQALRLDIALAGEGVDNAALPAGNLRDDMADRKSVV